MRARLTDGRFHLAQRGPPGLELLYLLIGAAHRLADGRVNAAAHAQGRVQPQGRGIYLLLKFIQARQGRRRIAIP